MIRHFFMILLIGLWSSETLSATKCTKNDLKGPAFINYTFGSGSSYQQGICGIDASSSENKDYCLNTTYAVFFDVLKIRTSVKPNCLYQVDLTLSDQVVTFKGKLDRATGNGSGSALAKAKGYKLTGTHTLVTIAPQ